MGLKTWDDEAEAYLKRVVSIGPGRGSGGVPGAFPTTYFEMTWVRFACHFQEHEPLQLTYNLLLNLGFDDSTGSFIYTRTTGQGKLRADYTGIEQGS